MNKRFKNVPFPPEGLEGGPRPRCCFSSTANRCCYPLQLTTATNRCTSMLQLTTAAKRCCSERLEIYR